MIKEWLHLLLISFSLTLISGVSYAAMPPKYKPSFLYFSGDLDYFSTSANFPSDGSASQSLTNSGSFSVLDFDFVARYAHSKRFAVKTSLGVGYVKSDDGAFERTNSEITEFGIGFDYRIFREMTADFQVLIPFNRVDVDTDKALTGEGALQITPGLWFFKTFGKRSNWIRPYSYLGYNYRDEGRAQSLLLELGLEKKFSGFIFGSSYENNFVVKEDEFTNTPTERTTVATRVNAGSSHFYAINPEVSRLKVWADFSVGSYTGLKLGVGHTLTGENSAEGFSLFTSFTYKFPVERTKKSRQRAFGKKVDKELDRFEVDDEAYDEDLFKPKKKKKKKPKRRSNKKSNKQLLDEAEELLEN